MNLLILNLYYEPDLAATAQLMKELAEDLAAGGHGVTVVTSRPSYSTESMEMSVPDREARNGVDVYRVWSSRWGRAGVVGRIINYLSFYLSAMVRALTLPSADVVLVLSSPPFIGIVGVLVKWLRGARLVYGIQDLIPDLLVAGGLIRNRLLVGLMEWISRFLMRTADHIIVIGTEMRAKILAKGIPHGKVTLIHNWCDGRSIRPTSESANAVRSPDTGPCVVLYAGNLGLMHDLPTLVSGMELLADQKNIRFLFVGGGVRTGELQEVVKKEGWKHVEFRPYCRGEEFVRVLNTGDIHLVLLREGLAGQVIPTKVFPSMAVAKPIVAVCPKDSEIAGILVESDCGIVVPNGEGRGLAEALCRLRDDPALRIRYGENGRRALLETFDRRIAVRRYERVLAGACAAPGAA